MDSENFALKKNVYIMCRGIMKDWVGFFCLFLGCFFFFFAIVIYFVVHMYHNSIRTRSTLSDLSDLRTNTLPSLVATDLCYSAFPRMTPACQASYLIPIAYQA